MDTIENTKIENNKIIALFMGFVESGFERSKLYHSEKQIEINPIELWYDLDWNWLMEVVEKIEKLGYNFNITSKNATVLQNRGAIYQTNIYRIDGTTKIQATYETVVEFLKWYNKQNP